MSNLSVHLTLEEFTRSDFAAAHGIDNSLPADLLEEALTTAAMHEAIRGYLSAKKGKDVPMLVSSGWRCPALDLAIRKRPKTGDHALAKAEDFTAPAFGTPYEIAKTLAPVISDLGIGQLIYECPSPGREWVHVSTRTPDKIVNRVITVTPTGTAVGIQRIEG